MEYTNLRIYAGIHDGYAGSVPITQSINFYNKILKDPGVVDSACYVPMKDAFYMLEYPKIALPGERTGIF